MKDLILMASFCKGRSPHSVDQLLLLKFFFGDFLTNSLWLFQPNSSLRMVLGLFLKSFLQSVLSVK